MYLSILIASQILQSLRHGSISGQGLPGNLETARNSGGNVQCALHIYHIVQFIDGRILMDRFYSDFNGENIDR